MGNKAPCPPAISMAMQMHRSNGRCIAQCSMSRATPKATRHYAIIGQLLTPYCLGGRQGDNQQTYDEKYTYFAGHFDGHHDAPVLYRMHCPMEGVQGFPKKNTKRCHQLSTCFGIKMKANHWQCSNTTWGTSPDGAHPGLHLKPLDASIGQMPAPYCPGGRSINLLKRHKTLTKHNF